MISPFWRKHAPTIDPARFRASPAFLCSEGFDHRAYYDGLLAQRGTRIILAALPDEDGAFGAEMVEHRGRVISRDLLDSATDLWFLSSAGLLEGTSYGTPRVLDVGIGYGRLAHRLKHVAPGACIVGVDEIDAARRACREYLEFRGILDVDVYETIEHVPSFMPTGAPPFDFAINCHAWSECTMGTVARQLGWLADHGVPRIMIVPHANPHRSPHLGLGVWSDEHGGGGGPSFAPILAALGYRLTARATDPAGVDRLLFTHVEFR